MLARVCVGRRTPHDVVKIWRASGSPDFERCTQVGFCNNSHQRTTPRTTQRGKLSPCTRQVSRIWSIMFWITPWMACLFFFTLISMPSRVIVLITPIAMWKHGQPRRGLCRGRRCICRRRKKLVRVGIPNLRIGFTKGRALFLKVKGRTSTHPWLTGRYMGRVTIFTKSWQDIGTGGQDFHAYSIVGLMFLKKAQEMHGTAAMLLFDIVGRGEHDKRSRRRVSKRNSFASRHAQHYSS